MIRRDLHASIQGLEWTVNGYTLTFAVLASIFARYGSYRTPETFVLGVTPAIWVGAAFVGLGALAALFMAGRRRAPGQAIEPALETEGRHARGAMRCTLAPCGQATPPLE